jgi:hypothetical protein
VEALAKVEELNREPLTRRGALRRMRFRPWSFGKFSETFGGEAAMTDD